LQNMKLVLPGQSRPKDGTARLGHPQPRKTWMEKDVDDRKDIDGRNKPGHHGTSNHFR
jgi:hypothetical protein